MSNIDVQTRDQSGEILIFHSLVEAFKHANATRSVWKVSFPLANGERCRLVRVEGKEGKDIWQYESLMDAVNEMLSQGGDKHSEKV